MINILPSRAKKDGELVKDLCEAFSISISGINLAQERLNELKSSWFNITYAKRQEKEFLVFIIDKLKDKQIEFEKELNKFLNKESESFLKSYKE